MQICYKNVMLNDFIKTWHNLTAARAERRCSLAENGYIAF